ncbi:MAG: ABC transporter substrate binding protein [Candidatus Omnitrophota bacterium]
MNNVKKVLFLGIVLSIFLFIPQKAVCGAKNYRGKKILYINSYHQGYYWSDGEQNAAQKSLSDTGVQFTIAYMDTKNNPSAEFSRRAGLKIKKLIQEFKPDVVIAADDTAFRYVIMPYYRNKPLPVVLCGINWDLSPYGAPYKNTTGMLEIGLVESIYKHLRKIAKGNRVGLISFDSFGERKNAGYYRQYIDGEFIRVEFVKDFASWKQKFIEMQDKVDMLIVADPSGIRNWNITQAEQFVLEHIRIPVGTETISMIPIALVGVTKVPEEQGEYAARTALRILDGEKPSDIPIVSNKKGNLYVNLKIANKLGVIFNPATLRSAKAVIGSGEKN